MNKNILILIAVILIIIGGFLILNNKTKTPTQTSQPEVCTTDYKPVCGKDGITYNNTCEALQAGTRIDYTGKCGLEIKTNQLTEEQIKNTTYYIGSYETYVTFKNGKFENNNPEEYLVAGIYEDMIAFGDLDQDGIDDSATIVYSNGGGSGTFIELAIVLNDYGSPVYWTSTALGDRTKINSIEIEDGEIKLNAIVHDEEDLMCCPTKEENMTFILKNNELQKKEAN